MKASELITEIQKIIDSNSDLNIGFYNMEYSMFQNVDEVKIRNADFKSGICSDAKSLGDIFIGID